MIEGRPPLRSASQTTSPPLDGVEELRALPLPPSGGEVSRRSRDGVGETVDRTRRQPGTTSHARNLRQGSNQAEALLWLERKRSQLAGHKFTRQFPIAPYFADFCCRKARLVVEVDGSQHADSDYDRRRDEFFRQNGYSTLRYWSHDVLKHRSSVCETILAALDGKLVGSVIAPDLRFVPAHSAEAGQ